MSIFNVNNQTSNGVKKIAISVCVAVSFFAIAGLAFAQSYTPLAPLPIGAGGAELRTYTLTTYLTGMLKLIIALGAVLSVFVAIVGGTQYVASGIAPNAKQDAKERIANALIGLALVLASYLILNSISPNLVAFDFGLPPVGTEVVPVGPVVPPETTYIITSRAGAGGSITPRGTRSIPQGASPSYSITPESGYNIDTLVIDGVSIAPSSAYTFPNVQAAHTIEVTFVSTSAPLGSFTITAMTGQHGTVTPLGVATVTQGGSQSYAITPDAGYNIATLEVDGAGVAVLGTRTFSNVIANHTISATFSPASSPSTPPAGLDPTNDYSIITHCIGNTTYSLCLKTDLNGDGKTDAVDLGLFLSRGGSFDVNRSRIVELANLATPVSCFLKISTANVSAILPHNQLIEGPIFACGGSGANILPPTVACNGVTWVKASLLSSNCAADATLFDSGTYGSSNQYDRFKNWITGSLSGGRIDLTTLFVKTFFPSTWGFSTNLTYAESDIGKITYATIAQYDLNNDGFVDFNSGGADMAVFNGCKGGAATGSCAQADFNADGIIDDRDVATGRTVQHPGIGSVVDLVRNYILGTAQFLPFAWKVGDFESNFFDPAGYSDKQIINYCMDRKAWFGCAMADVNRDQVVSSADLAAFNDSNTGAPRLDFNNDGKVDLQ